MVDISSELTSYTSLTEEEKDLRVLRYSNRTLSMQTATLRNNNKDLKRELSQIKEKHVEKSAKSYVIQNEIVNGSLKPATTSKKQERTTKIPQLRKTQPVVTKEKVVTVNNKKATVLKFNPVLDNNEFLLLDHLKLNQKFQLRSNYAQIEYTKSNLFAYFVIRFDLIFNINAFKHQSNLPPQPNQLTSKSILSDLKITNDSFDGHSIIIENNHKILDIDLSEWTLRREIYNSGPFIDNANIYNEIVTKCSAMTDMDGPPLSDSDVTVIQYTFPKNFKLKRRKKINLLAAGGKKKTPSSCSSLLDLSSFSNESSGYFSSNLATSSSLCSSLSCNNLSELKVEKSENGTNLAPALSTLSLMSTNSTSTVSSVKSCMIASKCACCSCKMLIKRKGDVEFFEIGEVATWGSGILVITKMINNKGVVKLVNFKFLKHIWVNNCKH